jgi:nitrite reductase/ring-hydroxylating ferredoxin subunit
MKKWIYIVVILIGIQSCREKLYEPMPYINVNFSLGLNDPGNGNLTGIGGILVVPDHGLTGVIVYHRGEDDYVAYERTCPYKPSDRCAVSIDDNLVSVTDSACCESRFLLNDGLTAQGPSVAPLHQYRVFLSNSTLYITNN